MTDSVAVAPPMNEHRMMVLLASVGNPDFQQDPSRALPGVPTTWLLVESLEDASRQCRAYIAEHNLGGGNWFGGSVVLYRVPVARISFNGRIWCPDGSEFNQGREVAIRTVANEDYLPWADVHQAKRMLGIPIDGLTESEQVLYASLKRSVR